jgi:(S)-2-hydroxyglutarate dehydrogenase
MVDEQADVVVVGAGIVGLATACELLRRRPDLIVRVVEKDQAIAGYQSSHNSGVLHAGIYYAPGSLKARLCGRGKGMIERYAAERGIPIKTNGKIVIATHEEELDRLHALAERSAANNVPGTRLIGPTELRELEPAATGVAALHSPSTGVIDFAAVCRALADDLVAAGGTLSTSWPVAEVAEPKGGEVEVRGDRGVVHARAVICCAGVQADRLAGHPRDVRIVPFRGSWYRVRGEIAAAIRGNVYPVPDPRFPFLGVHLTRRIDGEVWAGPNAFLTLAREGSGRVSVNLRDARAALLYGGLWRFAGRHAGAAVPELRHELSRRAYAREVSRYVPGVAARDLERGPAGIRAQAMLRDGTLVDDFVIRGTRRVMHVLSAPSPAATASMAIAEMLVNEMLPRMD